MTSWICREDASGGRMRSSATPKRSPRNGDASTSSTTRAAPPDSSGRRITRQASACQNPATRSALYGTATGDRLAEAAGRLHDDIARHVAAMLRRRSTGLSEERALLTGSMALATVKAVMPMITSASAERGAELVDELKLMLVRYLG
ncbi:MULTISPECIES: hypothetical protein [unclassified Nonomuraea]|uniref:hypothetical protein n=1 Tax=unclassified Nonomuraea TaxID=2593643 RepID=UPI001378389B|nr:MULTISPECIES: hypothetical protein [unclassified Nonomuraea]NBF00006.1 hypothetical protein [Nonomuraea sp. K271]